MSEKVLDKALKSDMSVKCWDMCLYMYIRNIWRAICCICFKTKKNTYIRRILIFKTQKGHWLKPSNIFFEFFFKLPSTPNNINPAQPAVYFFTRMLFFFSLNYFSLAPRKGSIHGMILIHRFRWCLSLLCEM